MPWAEGGVATPKPWAETALWLGVEASSERASRPIPAKAGDIYPSAVGTHACQRLPTNFARWIWFNNCCASSLNFGNPWRDAWATDLLERI